jgi:CheY-like chemotaxis protein
MDIRVLMVEDFGVNQEVFKAVLENTSIKLDIVYSGSDAIKRFKVRDGQYDVIFMDIQMAEMDGYETTRRIRTLPEIQNTKNVPIIAMTAKSSPEDVEKFLRAGMTDYINKPVSRESVMEKIKKYTNFEDASATCQPAGADDVSAYSKYLPYVDVEDMEKRIGCGIEVCKALLKDFLNNGYIDEFSRTLQNKDRFRAKEIIHNIKGISSNLSLSELYAKSVEYEQKIKDSTDTYEDLEAMKELIKITKENIQAFTS